MRLPNRHNPVDPRVLLSLHCAISCFLRSFHVGSLSTITKSNDYHLDRIGKDPSLKTRPCKSRRISQEVVVHSLFVPIEFPIVQRLQ
jgi:hypothetical protein